MKRIVALLFVAVSAHALSSPIDSTTAQNLERILSSEDRSPENRHRDQYRHPAETLAFFGIRNTDTVVEILPGGGWYMEILAPLLKQHGKLYEASYPEKSPDSSDEQARATANLKRKLAAMPALYSAVTVTELSASGTADIAPPGTADLVLTFRNVHNWLKNDSADQMFSAFFKVLKPDGVLGVVEHRANPGTTLEQTIKSGYVTEAQVIQLAEKAGFKLVAKSEINANPKDTKDYPGGVWTLPPSLSGDPAERARFLAIGESDRMTMKFVKPAR